MDKQQAASDIIAHALPNVPFDGWSLPVLEKAAIDAGYQKTDIVRVFPGGAVDAVDFFLQRMNEAMLGELKNYSLDTMKIRARIATCVRVKLTLMEPYREAVRKAIAVHALPLHCHRALGGLYETAGTIWYAAGDNSTDFNFYTKRLLLAGVYSATVLFWLNDKSPDRALTWAFLDRRIENVMKIEKAKHRIKGWLQAHLPA